MDLTLDATVGGENSNTYGTLEEALFYFKGRSDASAFTEASEEEQIARLIQATRINDLVLIPYGKRTNENQSLDFPRTNLIDKHGRKYKSDEIPALVKYAEFEQALYLMSNSTKLPSILTQGFSEAKLDVMSIKVDATMIPKKLDTDAFDFLSIFGELESTTGLTSIVNVIRY